MQYREASSLSNSDFVDRAESTKFSMADDDMLVNRIQLCLIKRVTLPEGYMIVLNHHQVLDKWLLLQNEGFYSSLYLLRFFPGGHQGASQE
jgi:hypothetical protein